MQGIDLALKAAGRSAPPSAGLLSTDPGIAACTVCAAGVLSTAPCWSRLRAGAPAGRSAPPLVSDTEVAEGRSAGTAQSVPLAFGWKGLEPPVGAAAVDELAAAPSGAFF
jgi:hypothetical protein